MKNIKLVTTPPLDALWLEELLFTPIITHLVRCAESLGVKIFYPGSDERMKSIIAPVAAEKSTEQDYIVPAPAFFTEETLAYLLCGGSIADRPADTCIFITDYEILTSAESVLRVSVARAHIRGGVRIIGPDSVYISADSVIEPGARILPNTIIRGGSIVRAGAVVGPNSLVDGAEIAAGASVNSSQVYSSEIGEGTTVGPFAYIRPGCKTGKNCRIGDFVELKNAELDDGAKVSHLAYVGDAAVGKRVNFSCGSITSNYDGVSKHRTVIGDDAFIGCNTNLVAPVTVGEGAYTAAGTTVTQDVPPNALAIGRVRAELKPDWALKIQRLKAEKAAKKK